MVIIILLGMLGMRGDASQDPRHDLLSQVFSKYVSSFPLDPAWHASDAKSCLSSSLLEMPGMRSDGNHDARDA